jgi:hypothetical protein
MTIQDRQNRLRNIAIALRSGDLTTEDTDFLSGALIRIADGEDAKTVLNIKAKRGERSSKSSHEAQKNSEKRRIFALGWIAKAKAPEVKGGLGLTLEEAIGLLGENSIVGKRFGLTEETLKTYWSQNPDLQNLEMNLPD